MQYFTGTEEAIEPLLPASPLVLLLLIGIRRIKAELYPDFGALLVHLRLRHLQGGIRLDDQRLEIWPLHGTHRVAVGVVLVLTVRVGADLGGTRLRRKTKCGGGPGPNERPLVTDGRGIIHLARRVPGHLLPITAIYGPPLGVVLGAPLLRAVHVIDLALVVVHLDLWYRSKDGRLQRERKAWWPMERKKNARGAVGKKFRREPKTTVVQ